MQIVTYTNNIPLNISPRYTITPTINTTLYTLSQLQALTQPIVVLFGINFTNISASPVCNVFTDNYCATNYNNLPIPALYQNGRLGLVSNNPYKDSNFSQLLYFTPTNNGNLISLYNTIYSTWITYTFSELSLDISTYAVGIYDVYIYINYNQLVLYLDGWNNNQPQNRAYLNGKIVFNSDNNKLFLGSIQVHAVGTYAIDKIQLQSKVSTYYSNVSVMKRLAPSSNGNEVFFLMGYSNASDLPITSFILNDIGAISTDENLFDYSGIGKGIATDFATSNFITSGITKTVVSAYPSNVVTSNNLGIQNVELNNRTAGVFSTSRKCNHIKFNIIYIY